ncbi:c-type cytochrome [Novilysobacter antarcticus]|uniref:c-type cytochrome n=1 Tax=Novilysobacter antarcticus TaxID=2862543 RepID=UPI001C99666F|nr:c-type cytochrome [Lysobacter antarcticus]
MSHARVLGIAGLVVFAAAAVAYAQTTVTPVPDAAPVETAPLAPAAPEHATWGDAQNGQALAGTCAACHGLDGNSEIPMYPRLAGQSERYIAHQLALFKSGERNDGMAAVMKPFADMLSAQDAHDLGAYFATQKSGAGVADDSVVTSGPYADKKFYQIGEQLFRGGDPARGIPACMACHGPSGAGNPGPAYPHVGGQHADYSQQRLELYRAGTTSRTDPRLFNIMASIAKPLTDEEIGSLASYMQGLHPAADDIGLDAKAMAAAPAPVAAPAADATNADGGAAPDTAATPPAADAPAAEAPEGAEPATDVAPEDTQG